MQEILFRAKRMDSGVWIQSSTILYDKGKCIMFYRYPSDNSLVGTEVDPTTIGQYVGVRDKNDNRIFVGDIVEIYTLDNHSSIDVIEDKSIIYYLDSRSSLSDIKVIGNKFDNQDLLKEI